MINQLIADLASDVLRHSKKSITQPKIRSIMWNVFVKWGKRIIVRSRSDRGPSQRRFFSKLKSSGIEKSRNLMKKKCFFAFTVLCGKWWRMESTLRRLNGLSIRIRYFFFFYEMKIVENVVVQPTVFLRFPRNYEIYICRDA